MSEHFLACNLEHNGAFEVALNTVSESDEELANPAAATSRKHRHLQRA